MQVTPKNISDFSYSQRFVKGIASRSIVPLIMLEAFVEGGRTYQAYKRGGFDEARERITEEMIAAAFWFSGVAGFNRLIDLFVGKKMLKLPETNFDVAKDAAHNPLQNYLKKFNFKNLEEAEKKIAKFKFGKAISSILLANVLVGFAVPKLNQAITKKLRKKREQNKQSKPETQTQTNTAQTYSFDKFINNSKDKKQVPFEGGSTQLLLGLANSFENDARYQLLSTDVGIAGGRAICARNNHERTEVLFRDITSSYFYMFNMPVMAMFLNRLQDGKKTRLDPVAAQQVTDHLNEVLKDNQNKMSVEKFKTKVLGNRSNKYKISPTLDRVLRENENIISVDEFKNIIKQEFTGAELTKLNKLAEGMSKLQPELCGQRILTKNQIKDIFTGGSINNPEFLQNVYRIATKEEKRLFTETSKLSLFENPLKFISSSTLEGIKQEMLDYVELVIKKAEKSGKEVTKELLESVRKDNFRKNAFNWGSGFAISAIFLSTLIPKLQYYITKLKTGHDEFPGTADYSYEKK